MIEFFESLNMNKSLVIALNKQGISALTDVQQKAIPQALANKDLVVQSETGTGKTLAYLLPLFSKIDPAKREMQAVILAPTHELAMQILRQIEMLAKNSQSKQNTIPGKTENASNAIKTDKIDYSAITATPIIGNVNMERQVEKLREKPHIIVGTPGRILELIKKKKITAHTVKTIIIDEADTLTSENNIETIREIVKSTLRERQLLMYSATITKLTQTRARELMKEPEFIIAGGITSIPAAIEHTYFLTEERDKLEVLRKVIGIVKPQKALVFIGAREDADYCTNRLRYHGLKVEALHGHTDKKDRKRVMEDFRAGTIPVLVVSDIAARGLDIQGVTHVFNISIPEQPKDYLHRVGRTGRIGNKGYAISIVTERELQFIEEFEKALKIEIIPMDMFKGSLIHAKKKR